MGTGQAFSDAPEREWLTTSQAARTLNLSPQRIDQLAKEGQLPFTSTPLGRLFHVRAVEALKAEREAKAASQPDKPDATAAPSAQEEAS